MKELNQNPQPYRTMVANLAKPGSQIKEQLSANDAHNIHMAIGIAGEAGELLDAIKKKAIYNKPLDRANVIEELGDIEFYMEGLRSALNITRDDVLAANMEKLTRRYGKNYSDSAAQERADKK